MKRKIRKVYPKLIIQPELWLATTQEVRDFRLCKIEKGGLCEVTQETLKRPSLDHKHDCYYEQFDIGKVRGVISGFVNSLEGRYLKLFNKYARKHTKLTFANFLIALGEYLNKDYSNNPLHFKMIQDKRTELLRLTIPEIKDILLKDYNVKISYKEKLSKVDLVYKYLQEYVYSLERGFDEKQ